jgi:hypothetical protein
MFYRCLANLNLYDSPLGDRLATQVAKESFLSVKSGIEPEQSNFLAVTAIADRYPGYLASEDLIYLEPYLEKDLPIIQPLSLEEIRDRLPKVIEYALYAQKEKNEYFWGGNLPPNFDCSGLVQAAFLSVGIQIPRDAYQQEAFSLSIPFTDSFKKWIAQLQLGDLIFFGSKPDKKATHVGLYLGNQAFIHSSGKEYGHNAIAIDTLLDPHLDSYKFEQAKTNQTSHKVAKHYASQLRGAGRIYQNYCRDR